ncbi:hypothetical protein BDV28DRAFT_132317 [Aspergillus coremiiformis]|uniref:Uncharacterized protein n=1 Tax=Aspergillus coremiiformis TaxID=138285 RepID=A0A5N6ZAE8_9EURO|nr:hypothetical protein BDV28DRAFT_132317 [Aspergillus coremiiformis]
MAASKPPFSKTKEWERISTPESDCCIAGGKSSDPVKSMAFLILKNSFEEKDGWEIEEEKHAEEKNHVKLHSTLPEDKGQMRRQHKVAHAESAFIIRRKNVTGGKIDQGRDTIRMVATCEMSSRECHDCEIALEEYLETKSTQTGSQSCWAMVFQPGIAKIYRWHKGEEREEFEENQLKWLLTLDLSDSEDRQSVHDFMLVVAGTSSETWSRFKVDKSMQE